ncbi:MAG: methylmalonyl-CoA epimerase [Chloroflexota bacterium]
MPTIKRIHHVALVVDDLERALSFWRDALGLPLGAIEDIPEQQSKVAFLRAGASDIELVKPITDDSGIARYLAKRGPGMHHVCLEVSDLDQLLARLRQRGIRLITPAPVTGSDGKRMAFIHPESAQGVLVELYQLPHPDPT